jgi:hypothetical protein
MALFNSRLKVTIIIGLIWMVVSLVVYLLATNEPTGTQNLALFFLLLAEALITGFLAFQELVPAGTGPLFRIGTYSSLAIFAVVALPTAIIHATGRIESTTWLIIIELVLIALLFSIEILFYRSSKSVAETDRISAAKMGVVMNLRARLDNMAKLNTLSPEISAQLNRVIEEVRYFDKNSSVATDTAIGDKITALESLLAQSGGDTPTTAANLLNEMLALTQIRKREASDGQRGGF